MKMMIALVTLVLAVPASGEIRMENVSCPFAGNTAMKIIGAAGETDGVDAEYVWIKKQRPGFAVSNQATRNAGGKIFDVLTIRKGDQMQSICFDVTDFFGRY